MNLGTGEAIRLARANYPAAVKSEANAAMADLGPAPAGWEHRLLQDVRAELEGEGVPERLVSVVEHLASGCNWGLSDPMYMANVVAFEFGWGTGQGVFGDCTPPPAQALCEKVAARLHFSYSTSFGELGLDGAQVLERLLAGLRGPLPEAGDGPSHPQHETPRGA